MNKLRMGMLFCLFLSVTVLATMDPRTKIEEKNIISFVSQLAADPMEGRRSGEPSGRRAEEYIAGKFQEFGLKPAGDDGTYFQRFRFPMKTFTTPGELKLLRDGGPDKSYNYGDDYYSFPVSSGGQVRAEVVFVGYGISRPDLGFDEYAGIETAGKVLVASSGAPAGDRAKWGRDWTDYAKADQAIKHDALGLLIFDPDQKELKLPRFRIWSFNIASLKRGLVFVKVGRRVTEDLFEHLPMTPEMALNKINGNIQPQSFATGCRVELSAETMIDSEREAANVIGKIEGSDPALRNELVLISGHYDGGGMDPDGVIYSGANDNASGIGVLLEIARVMKANNVRPARSLLFIGWGAEEQGAYGSQYFVNNSTVPLGKIASAFIMDCVGLGEGKFWLFGAGHFSKPYEDIKAHLDRTLWEPFQPRAEAGSDQYYFQQKEVVSFFTHNIRGDSFEHTPQDDVETLNAAALKKVALFVYEAALYVAAKKE
jgi:hypothetical protein